MSYNAYKTHVFRKHRNSAGQYVPNSGESPDSDESPEIESNVPLQTEAKLEATIQNQCGIMFLTLLAQHNVTNPALQTILNCFKEMGIANNVKIRESLLNSTLIDQISKDDLISFNINLFKTEFLRKQYFKMNFDFVSYKTIISGRNSKLCEFYYVSLLDTIPSFLKNTSMERTHYFENYLTDFNDARLFQNNPFFNSSVTKLLIILYHDVFNFCNPLGQYNNSKKSGWCLRIDRKNLKL